mgnify:CR=1 FL=1
MTAPATAPSTTPVRRLEAVANSLIGNPNKHMGALRGFTYMVVVSVLVGIVSIVFPTVYSRDVNGPVACGFAIASGVIAIMALSYWLSALHRNDPLADKLSGARSAVTIMALIMCLSLVLIFAYKDQSGGLQLNGLETSIILTGMGLTMLFVQNIMMKIMRHAEQFSTRGDADTGG